MRRIQYKCVAALQPASRRSRKRNEPCSRLIHGFSLGACDASLRRLAASALPCAPIIRNCQLPRRRQVEALTHKHHPATGCQHHLGLHWCCKSARLVGFVIACRALHWNIFAQLIGIHFRKYLRPLPATSTAKDTAAQSKLSNLFCSVLPASLHRVIDPAVPCRSQCRCHLLSAEQLRQHPHIELAHHANVVRLIIRIQQRMHVRHLQHRNLRFRMYACGFMISKLEAGGRSSTPAKAPACPLSFSTSAQTSAHPDTETAATPSAPAAPAPTPVNRERVLLIGHILHHIRMPSECSCPDGARHNQADGHRLAFEHGLARRILLRPSGYARYPASHCVTCLRSSRLPIYPDSHAGPAERASTHAPGPASGYPGSIQSSRFTVFVLLS